MNGHKLHVEAACDTNLVLWNSFKKSVWRSFCKVFTHYFLKIFLFLFGAYSVWALTRIKDSMTSEYEYPEFTH